VLRHPISIAAFVSVAVAAGTLACSSGTSGAPDGGQDSGPDSSNDSTADSTADVRAKDARSDSRIHDAGTESHDGASGPFLTELSVTGSSLTLIPTFSPDIHDYYLTCAAGMNAFTVSMKASPGANSELVQPHASPPQPTQTLSVTVVENDAIVAAATKGSETVDYWVRCLPHDFPALVWTEHPDAGTATPGYYLIGGYDVPAKGTFAYAFVLDGHGVPVWYYAQANGTGVVNVDSLQKGEISFVPFPQPFPYEVIELTPWTVTKVPINPPDQHELRHLANGHYLLFVNPPLTGVDLTGLDVPLPDGGTLKFGLNSVIQDCIILEIDPASKVDGGVAWKWKASDHFDPAIASTSPILSTEIKQPDGGPIVDPIHCNSMDVDSNGDLLVSARNFDSVFYIDKLSQRVLWKMGGANSSKDPITFIPVDDPFNQQHDARLQAGWSMSCTGGAGPISVFDDESNAMGPGAAARAAVYDVSVALGDGGTGADCGAPSGDGGAKATLTWSYKGKKTSSALGSFRILPDGSRTIGWGNTYTPGLVFNEVDDKGKDLLEFDFGDGRNGSYRAVKVPLTQLDLQVMRRTAGHP
jgi:hypothetical protein